MAVATPRSTSPAMMRLATSRATGRQVSDALAAPDMAALTACQTELAALPEAPLPPLANQVSLDFDASPTVESRATPEDYRAQPFQQPAPRHHGAAGGDQIVNQHHLVAGTHSVGVQFHRSASIFQFMGFGDSIERQLDLARCVLELGKP